MKLKSVAILIFAPLMFWPSNGVRLVSCSASTIAITPKTGARRVELAVSSDRLKFMSDSKITLKLSVRNFSTRSIIVVATSPERDYGVVVKDESGSTLTMRPKRIQQFGRSSRREQVKLRPGESLQDDLELTNLYDLERPGRYTIVASRTFITMPRGRREKVISDPLSITVIR